MPRPHAGERVLWLRYTSLHLPRLLLPTPSPPSSPFPVHRCLSFSRFIFIAFISGHAAHGKNEKKKHVKNLVTLHNLLNTNGSPASRNSPFPPSPLPLLSALFPLITRTNFGCSLCCTHSSTHAMCLLRLALRCCSLLAFQFSFSLRFFIFPFRFFFSLCFLFGFLFFFDFLFAFGR